MKILNGKKRKGYTDKASLNAEIDAVQKAVVVQKAAIKFKRNQAYRIFDGWVKRKWTKKCREMLELGPEDILYLE